MKFYLTQIKNKTPPARTLPTIRTISGLIFYLTQIKNQKQTPLLHDAHLHPLVQDFSKKNKLYFYLTQIKFVFRSPSKLSPQGTFAKMKQKCFAHPSEQAKQTQTKTDLLYQPIILTLAKFPDIYIAI